MFLKFLPFILGFIRQTMGVTGVSIHCGLAPSRRSG